MPDPIVGTIAGVAGSVIGAGKQADAAETASDAQVEAAQLGVDESRRKFNKVQKLLKPYRKAGKGGLGGQMDLLGLNGPEAQANAIAVIEGGPQMAAMIEQGENAILQNASATGGLRGGNTQGALAGNRQQILSSLIESQYGKLGGLASLGQASAAQTGAAGQASGSEIANLLAQQGAATAGGALAQGQASANMWGNIAGGAGQIAGMWDSSQSNGGLF